MSSTTWATVRPLADPSGVMVNLIAPVRRVAGFPQGNLQGSVRGICRLAAWVAGSVAVRRRGARELIVSAAGWRSSGQSGGGGGWADRAVLEAVGHAGV